jgi:hypothetical protein
MPFMVLPVVGGVGDTRPGKPWVHFGDKPLWVKLTLAARVAVKASKIDDAIVH